MITEWIVSLSLMVVSFVVGILPTVTWPSFLDISNYLSFDLSNIAYFFPFQTQI